MIAWPADTDLNLIIPEGIVRKDKAKVIMARGHDDLVGEAPFVMLDYGRLILVDGGIPTSPLLEISPMKARAFAKSWRSSGGTGWCRWDGERASMDVSGISAMGTSVPGLAVVLRGPHGDTAVKGRVSDAYARLSTLLSALSDGAHMSPPAHFRRRMDTWAATAVGGNVKIAFTEGGQVAMLSPACGTMLLGGITGRKAGRGWYNATHLRRAVSWHGGDAGATVLVSFYDAEGGGAMVVVSPRRLSLLLSLPPG
jgi:hypothetical protein